MESTSDSSVSYKKLEEKTGHYLDVTPIDKLYADCERIRKKYPNKIPVIVRATEGLELKKCKFLVPGGGTFEYKDEEGNTKTRTTKGITVGQFEYVIRKRIQLTPEQAIFIFINKSIPNNSQLMSHVYDEYLRTKKHDHNYLVCEVSTESTFG